MIGSESIGFSGSQFRLVVETINNPAGELAFCSAEAPPTWAPASPSDSLAA